MNDAPAEGQNARPGDEAPLHGGRCVSRSESHGTVTLEGEVLAVPRPMGLHAKCVALSVCPTGQLLHHVAFQQQSRGTRLQDQPVTSPTRPASVREKPTGSRPMGPTLVGEVLTAPRPMGPHVRTVTLSRLSHGTQHSERSSFRHSPVGRASKTHPWPHRPDRRASARSRPRRVAREANRSASHGTDAGRQGADGSASHGTNPKTVTSSVTVPRDAALRTLQLSQETLPQDPPATPPTRPASVREKPTGSRPMGVASRIVV